MAFEFKFFSLFLFIVLLEHMCTMAHGDVRGQLVGVASLHCVGSGD